MEPEAIRATSHDGDLGVLGTDDIISDSLALKPVEETPGRHDSSEIAAMKRNSSVEGTNSGACSERVHLRFSEEETLTNLEARSGIQGLKRSISCTDGPSEEDRDMTSFRSKARKYPKGTREVSENYVKLIGVKAPEPILDSNPSDEDVKFMTQAQKVSENSKDPSTKVGAIVVDPNSKKVLGEGWNRMPKGCEDEDRFPWNKGPVEEDSKYSYVLHGVHAAILDALKKTSWNSLNGATVYSTLIPDNKDAQVILEVGIKRVVFRDDDNKETGFTYASKRILKDLGNDFSQIKMPRPQRSTPDSD